MHQRISTNQTSVLICLIGILLTGCVAEDKQCEVLDVSVKPNEVNSTFVYGITYKDPSCPNKGKLKGKLINCNGSDIYQELVGEGEVHNCFFEGMWMVTVSKNVNSTCFHCWGLYMKHHTLPFLRYDFLNITLKNVHPAVKNWNLTIYKTTVKADFYPCRKGTNLNEITERFQDTHLKANITLSLITLKHSFDPNACYCLVLNPISHLPLEPRNTFFTTSDCRPTAPSPENGVSPIDDLSMSKWEEAEWGVLVGMMLLMVAMIFVAFRSPVFLSKILRLKRLIVTETPSEKPVPSCDSQVLLLYAPDISDSQDLNILKKNLQASFKVYDLFDRPDHNQLADPCGWTEEVLLSTTGVKVLLVESVGLLKKIASLLDSDKESFMDAMVAKKSLHDKTAESLLTFALRTIIASSLRQDYSSVFVVRFTDEVRDAVDLLVQMRRYKFPDHFSELSKDMKEAKRRNV
ncbi:hypothetical protein O3P69_002073 [Scylla paramamosain]|uniref:SEFIR domain-containing protein n=1 Tax=Scylla paramamosain TaxID=85552 RepID=A0AAW0V4L0_SCYPA